MIEIPPIFPYFGGKSRAAAKVWEFLGDAPIYIEPFFGSGAVLFRRPIAHKKNGIEIVNDKDGFIANTWRAIQHAPDEVAKYCDYPENHVELASRRNYLYRQSCALVESIVASDDFFCPKTAGYWLYAMSCWIGRGCVPKKEAVGCGGVPRLTGNQGVCKYSGDGLRDVMETISQRLRRVKVVCGDWSRVCSGNWYNTQNKGGCGFFFDPPYDTGMRGKNLYRCDESGLAKKVSDWCVERGQIDGYKIVLAGYEGEHNNLESLGWGKYEWKASGGYGNQSDNLGSENKSLERLWYSPQCAAQINLF